MVILAICLDKDDNGYMQRLEILLGQAKCSYFSKEVRLFWLFASDQGDNAYMPETPNALIAEWATLLVDIHCPRGGS